MLDVTSTLVNVAWRQFGVSGLDGQRLAEGLQLPPPGSTNAFVDWNEFALFFGRACEVVGGEDRLSDLSESAAVPGLPEGQWLMAMSPDVVTGMQLINRLADATFAPALLRFPSFRRTGRDRYHVRLAMARRRGYRSALLYFYGMQGAFRAAPKYAGLESATVTASIEPYRADFEIQLPPSASTGHPSFEKSVKATFVRHWERLLISRRQEMLQLREAELRAREHVLFAKLSSAVARQLSEHQSGGLAPLAASTVRSVLGCRSVTISSVTAEGKAVLGVAGPPTRRIHAFELAIANGVLLIEADVAPGSPEAGAIKRLAPWLGLVCATVPPRPATPVAREEPWADARLRQLAHEWQLTPRQEQVCWLMALGESNKQIAVKLLLTEGTVELHAHAVLRKARIGSRAALAARFFSGS